MRAITNRAWPGMRKWLSCALAAALCTLGTGCSRDGRAEDDQSVAEPEFSIVPPSDGNSRAAAEQYSVSDGSKVTWGLLQQGAVSTARTAFPLRVAPNGRYLVDANGRPWRVKADAGWMMSSEATPDEVLEYLDQRKAQGFNAFYLHAAVHPGGYASLTAPNNWQGAMPFAVPGDFSTAGTVPGSERYWSWIDWIIDQAAARDIVVMLAYTYLGVGGGPQGWYAEVMAQPSRASLYSWGEWLGRRYKDKENIIWFGLGDYAPPAGSEGSLRAVAIADGIKHAGATQLFMAEANPPDDIPGEHPDFGPIVDMNSFYGYGPEGDGAVYVTADRAWREDPVKPAWMQEGTYEYENNSGHFSREPWDTRRGRYWSVLAGGTAGDGFGSMAVWQWADIPDSLSTPGAHYSEVAFDLFDSMPWWELAPSGTDPGFTGQDLITAGQGTWGGLDYITSARTAAHDWLLAYVPVSHQGRRTFSVDLSAMAGPSRARWFDPATGNFLVISDGYSEPESGSREFTTPGLRSDGTDDWLLVLDTNGANSCGSITPSGRYSPPSSIPSGMSCDVTATLKSNPSMVARDQVSFGQL
jgi:Protein of unknown function (DUF4038)/Putative collagen-binding domain of a collagenase